MTRLTPKARQDALTAVLIGPANSHEKVLYAYVNNKGTVQALISTFVVRCFDNLTSHFYMYMNLVMRKPAFYICENKEADQLRDNREADQPLCSRYMDSTIPPLPRALTRILKTGV